MKKTLKNQIKPDKENRVGGLCITLKIGSVVTIGEDIILKIDEYNNNQIRMIIRAPKDMKILRHSFDDLVI